jgi:cation diffusion facilitator CzcD-associated flavoprotein CzcO
MLAYFEAYAARWAVRPRFGEDATGLERAGGGWLVRLAGGGALLADHVVVATGWLHEPIRPAWPGLERFPGPVLHSGEYRSPAALPGGPVLVVGFRNSGADVAADLARAGRAVDVSVRGPVPVAPRDLLGVPIQAYAAALEGLPPGAADALTGWLLRLATGRPERFGLSAPREGVFSQVRSRAAFPYLDHGALALVRAGRIRVRPEVRAFEGARAAFADGTAGTYDAVVLATGFRAGPSPLLLGAAGAAGGLHAVGFANPISGTLRRIARDAGRVADEIALG